MHAFVEEYNKENMSSRILGLLELSEEDAAAVMKVAYGEAWERFPDKEKGMPFIRMGIFAKEEGKGTPCGGYDVSLSIGPHYLMLFGFKDDTWARKWNIIPPKP
jgi:hypothetical protein